VIKQKSLKTQEGSTESKKVIKKHKSMEPFFCLFYKDYKIITKKIPEDKPRHYNVIQHESENFKQEA